MRGDDFGGGRGTAGRAAGHPALDGWTLLIALTFLIQLTLLAAAVAA